MSYLDYLQHLISMKKNFFKSLLTLLLEYIPLKILSLNLCKRINVHDFIIVFGKLKMSTNR